MDKRKLRVGRTVTGMLNIYATSSLKPFAYMSSGCDENYRELSEDDAHEIAKRWNEYPRQAERIAKLEEALRAILNEADDELVLGHTPIAYLRKFEIARAVLNTKALEALLWAEAAGLPVQEHIEQVRAAIAKATNP